MTDQLLFSKTATFAPRLEAAENAESAAASPMALLMRFQTTLQIDQLIAMLDEGISRYVDLTELCYREPDGRIAYRRGRAARHRLCYRLRLEGRHLGAITLQSRHGFEEPDIRRIEKLLSLLHHPLRNALIYREAVHSSHRDDLTGLYNRAGLDAALEREVELAQRHGQALSMLLLDIDDFKRVNDTWGHLAGDTVLRGVAETLRYCSRGSDLAFRYAGDEFVLGLPKTPLSGAHDVAWRVVRQVGGGDFRHDGQRLPVSVSVGVAEFAGDDSRETLFQRADRALYAAKAAGGGCVVGGG